MFYFILKLFRILLSQINGCCLNHGKPQFLQGLFCVQKFESIRYFRFFRLFWFHPDRMQTSLFLKYILATQLIADIGPKRLRGRQNVLNKDINVSH